MKRFILTGLLALTAGAQAADRQPNTIFIIPSK